MAGFHTIEEAKKAAQKLKENGFEELQVDHISMYPGDYLNDLTNPITGNFESLADLTLGSFTDKNAEVLAAADPNASGMADKAGMDSNYNFLVTLVTDDDHAVQAEDILKKYHGLF